MSPFTFCHRLSQQLESSGGGRKGVVLCEMDQAGAEVDTMSKPEGTAGPRALGRLCVFNSFLLLPYAEII